MKCPRCESKAIVQQSETATKINYRCLKCDRDISTLNHRTALQTAGFAVLTLLGGGVLNGGGGGGDGGSA